MHPTLSLALVLLASSQPIPDQPPAPNCASPQANPCACRDFAVGIPVGATQEEGSQSERSGNGLSHCPQGSAIGGQPFAVGVPTGREADGSENDGFAVGVPTGREADSSENDGFAVGVPTGREADSTDNDGFAVGVPTGREADSTDNDGFAVGVPTGREADSSESDGFAVGVPTGKAYGQPYTVSGWETPGAAQAYIAPGVVTTLVGASDQLIAFDGGDPFLQLRLSQGGGAEGAYNGDGDGSMAMVGITTEGPHALSALEGLSVDLRIPGEARPAVGISLALMVDLSCDPAAPRYAVVVVDLPTLGAGDWVSHGLSPEAPIYRSVGGVGGLPSLTEVKGAPLGALLARHPKACFLNANPMDSGLPVNTTLPAVSLILGDRDTSTGAVVHVDRLSVDVAGETYGFDLR